MKFLTQLFLLRSLSSLQCTFEQADKTDYVWTYLKACKWDSKIVTRAIISNIAGFFQYFPCLIPVPPDPNPCDSILTNHCSREGSQCSVMNTLPGEEYRCTCLTGYVGNGVNCTGELYPVHDYTACVFREIPWECIAICLCFQRESMTILPVFSEGVHDYTACVFRGSP